MKLNRVQRKIVVLMLEDNERLLAANTEIVSDLDCEVHGAKSIEEARQLLRRIRPDLAILDIILPDGNGLDFAAELRKISDRTWIIFLTAKTDKKLQVEGLKAGAINYLVKPYRSKELRTLVQNMLNNITATRTPSPAELLTPDELETVKLVISGESNKRIADILNRDVETIKTRLKKIYKKLEIEGDDEVDDGIEKRKRLKEILRDAA